MDPVTIAPLAISAWKILAPWIKKLAGKMIEKASDELPEAVGKVWDTVKEKMEAKPETQSLPAEVVAAPEDEDVQGAFKYQLKKLLENDEAFAKQLDQLVKDAGKAKGGKTYNATLDGDGAVAQGDNSVAIGKGGVYIGGNANDNVIVTGDEHKISKKKGKR